MTARIFRYEVPVDDRWHEFELSGDVLAVGCRTPTLVEFWARHSDDTPPVTRRFGVVGTGHPLPDNARHRGTVVAPGGHLVWHLLEAAGGNT
jgi:hypothetical protein